MIIITVFLLECAGIASLTLRGIPVGDTFSQSSPPREGPPEGPRRARRRFTATSEAMARDVMIYKCSKNRLRGSLKTESSTFFSYNNEYKTSRGRICVLKDGKPSGGPPGRAGLLGGIPTGFSQE